MKDNYLPMKRPLTGMSKVLTRFTQIITEIQNINQLIS
jgi:hypothetical protein